MFRIKSPTLSVEEVRKLWNNWVDQYPDPLESAGRPANPELMKDIISDLIKKLSLHPEDSLLDVGCGSGFMLNELVKKIPLQAAGVDIAEKHIQNAKKYFPSINFYAAPIESLPFPDQSFSKVMCYSTLTYSVDWKKSVDEVFRVCRDGGIVLFADMPLWHLRFYFYGSVIASIPSVLVNWKRLIRAFRWKEKDCPWYWTHLETLKAYIESKGYSIQVLLQPKNSQYGCTSYEYRRDILIQKIRRK